MFLSVSPLPLPKCFLRSVRASVERDKQEGGHCADDGYNGHALDGAGQAVAVGDPAEERGDDAAHAGGEPEGDAGSETNVLRQLFLPEHDH